MSLLREKRFDSITVHDISERAEVNRVTFYLHYRSKDDLLTQTMNDALDELGERHKASCSPSAAQAVTTPEALAEETQRIFALWFKHAAEHVELYRLVLDVGGTNPCALQVRRHLEQLLTTRREEGVASDRSDVPAGLQSRFLAAAFFGVIGWWIEVGMSPPAEQMAVWLWKLLVPPPPEVDVPVPRSMRKGAAGWR
ncbi:TetR/AcrR family transcriptional regulator [Chondromyces crocatus]|uniref:TetR/AcrR family transcriptional regulator n=1 Tax=Chondromyces crocatus TaxID=52 RepID=UPI001C54CE9A|nr:TetR/AcrR family transcriptional regulator [Chondromyces crocatus]